MERDEDGRAIRPSPRWAVGGEAFGGEHEPAQGLEVVGQSRERGRAVLGRGRVGGQQAAGLVEVAGKGAVLGMGVGGGEAEPPLLVVAELTQPQGRLDRALAVPPEAAGGVEAVVA